MFLVGAALTLLTAYATGALACRHWKLPAVVRFGIGAAAESVLVYLLLLCHLGKFLPVLFAAIPALFFIRPARFSEPAAEPMDRVTRWIVLPILAVFGGYYLVHALAPEIQPDAITYHLGLTAEYVRLGHFPQRIGFYEILPQGLEMLFAVAYSIGGDSAAKLVHYAFLAATIPLIVLTARRLRLTDAQGYVAATLYFAAPVAGISGTCAYNDAALVFFTLMAFYLLLSEHFLLAGIAAGFCYAIKLTGLAVPVLGLLYVLWAKRGDRWRFPLGALATIAPWMLRALILTHDPLAPLFNAWFPNLYFNAETEHQLAHALSLYPNFRWPTALWTWAFTGAAQGVVGPLILAAPLALLAWRKPGGRLLLAASALLLVPAAFNVGTRFLMPALPFLALALAIAIPRPAFLGLAVLQAALCFPPVIARIEQPNAWALDGFPWRAALRLESEPDYLKSATSAYVVARYIEDHTTAQDRILALNSVSTEFTTRDVLEFWHSNRALRYTAALQAALAQPTVVSTRAAWPAQVLSAVRFVSTEDREGEWSIFEARLYSPGGFLYNSPQWNLSASDNLPDAPMAFDGNAVTFWTSRTPQRRGMYLEADFNHPQLLDSARFLIAANGPQPGFAIEGRLAGSRQWQLLSDRFAGRVTQPRDLRRDAVHALKLAGFTAISVEASDGGLGTIGQDMLAHPARWGVKEIGEYGNFHLLRIVGP
jgi:hypothetical protein